MKEKRDWISPQDLVPVLSCAAGPWPDPVPGRSWCQGEHRRRSWLHGSDTALTCGTLRATVLLKLGHSACFSNDISAPKAIILTGAESGASLTISAAPSARRADLSRAPGSDHLLSWDSRTNSQRALVHDLASSPAETNGPT